MVPVELWGVTPPAIHSNMKKLWFKRKRYGWGWTPCSIEGWTVTLVLILSVISISMKYFEKNMKAWFSYLFLLIVIFIIIAYKTGEKPKFQWGGV